MRSCHTKSNILLSRRRLEVVHLSIYKCINRSTLRISRSCSSLVVTAVGVHSAPTLLRTLQRAASLSSGIDVKSYLVNFATPQKPISAEDLSRDYDSIARLSIERLGINDKTPLRPGRLVTRRGLQRDRSDATGIQPASKPGGGD